MTAGETLAGLLDEHAGRGRPVPCWGPTSPWWTAEDPQERAQAAERCPGCPDAVSVACRAAADEAHACWGVWDATDYSESVNQTWRRGR